MKLFQKAKQISESHCGPAVLEMMLDMIGVHSTQENITRAADSEDTIEEYGLRVDQLGLACARIASYVQFWSKHHTTLDDIRYVLNMGYVVGVEWQSLFYDTPEEEEPGHDYGHYSIILQIDEVKKEIVMADPYKDYIDTDRRFPIDYFLNRWWDTNDVVDGVGNKTEVRDEQVAFFVTAVEKTWPAERGFTAYQLTDEQLFIKPFLKLAEALPFKKPQRVKRIKGLLQGRLRRIRN